MAGDESTERTSLLKQGQSSTSQTGQTNVRDYFAPQSGLRPTTPQGTRHADFSQALENNGHEEVPQSTASRSVSYGTWIQQTDENAVNDSDSDSDNSSSSARSIPRPPLRTASNIRISHNEHRIQPPDLLRGILIVLQCIIITCLTTRAFPLSLSLLPESDGQLIRLYNEPLPWILTILAEFCGPGFTFLMGLGVVYFARARAQAGWGRWKFVRYFVIRAVLLAAINVVLSAIVTEFRPMILNTFLLALAVNYLLAGFLYLFITYTEKHLTSTLLQPLITLEDEDQARESLLRRGYSFTSEPEDPQIASRSQRNMARTISFHFHNVLLLIGTGVLFCLPIWTSYSGGHCTRSENDAQPPVFVHAPTFRTFLLYPMRTKHFSSPFPPIPFLPYALLGLIYTRVILPRKTAPKQKAPNLLRPGPSPLGFSAGAGKRKLAFWNRSARRLSLFDLMIGVAFLVLFILTRFLHFGNLSEDCLWTPSETAPRTNNNFLKDPRSWFYTTSYPPDPAHGFLCLSIIFLSLSLLAFVPSVSSIKDQSGRRVVEVLQLFGQSALFFTTLHVPVYVVLGYIVRPIFRTVHSWPQGAVGSGRWVGDASFSALHPSPTELKWVDVVGVSWKGFFFDWLVGLVIMWALCRWYGRFMIGKGSDNWWRLI